MSIAIKNQIEAVIRRVAEERDLTLPELKDSTELVDELGFASLQVAALLANLEEEFGVDPFQDENVLITDLRTIKDLRVMYTRALEERAMIARSEAQRVTQHA